MTARGALVACLVLAPALVRWWTGRALARSPDDPALGERLIASQKVNTFAFALAVSTAVVLTRSWWTIPLTVTLYIAAAYPLRRALYEETWSLGRYLSFTGRLLLGTAGFWIVLAAAPALVGSAGTKDWAAALVLGAGLLAWHARQGEILRALMGTRPLRSPALLARFDGLARQCAIATTRFEELDLRGGVIANAVALASRRGSAIVFTDTLLTRLDPDESAAICAHELAHLEHFNPRRLRQIALVTSTLIVAGVLLPVIGRLAGVPSIVMWVCWGCALLAALLWMARDRQKNETASDVRAVELTGDAEALVRALSKGYAISRMPRRLHPDFERRATHPSLARRIREIRRAGGVVPEEVPADTRLVAADTSTTVTFQPDRLDVREGDAALHSLGYAHLSELRIDARRSGGASLVVVERSGRRWDVPLRDVDVGRAQKALDAVDGRLSEAAAPRAAAWPVIGRVLATLLALMSMALGAFAALLVAVLAFIQSVPAFLGAAGAAGLVSSVLVLRDQTGAPEAVRIALAIVSATIGVALLIAAVAIQRAPHATPAARGRPGPPLALMALPAIVSAAIVAMQASSAVRVYLWARAAHSAAVLPIACAVALAFWRPRGWRIGTVLGATVGAAVLAAGSVAFLDAFGRDVLLVAAPPLPSRVIGDAPRAEYLLDFLASGLRLSPTGRHLALVRNSDYVDDDPAGMFLVGPPGGPLAEVAARDLLFLDDEHLLAMEPRGGGMQVRKLRASTPAVPVWEQHVPDILVAQLAADAGRGTWQVLGLDRDRRIVHVEGSADRETAPRRRVTAERPGSLLALAASGDTAVGLETRYSTAVPYALGLWRFAAWLPLNDSESRLWGLSGHDRWELGSSRLEARCFADSGGAPRLVCVTFEGTRSRVLTLDGRTRRLSAVGLLPGRFFAGARASAGWLPGWYDGHSVALDLRNPAVVRIEPGPGRVTSELAGASHVLGAVLQDGSRSHIRLWNVPTPAVAGLPWKRR